MNKALVYWVAQGVMVLVMAALAGFTALITMGAVAGVAIGIAPVAHFKLAGGLICPDGSEVSFEEGGEVVTYSGGTPSYGTAVQIYCIDAAGARTVLTADEGAAGMLVAVGAILGAYFLGGFLLMFVPAVIVGAILVHVIFNSITKRRQSGPMVTAI